MGTDMKKINRYLKRRYGIRCRDGVFDKIKEKGSAGLDKVKSGASAVKSGAQESWKKANEDYEYIKYFKAEIMPLKKRILGVLAKAQVLLAKVIKNITVADNQKDFVVNYPMLVQAVKLVADSSSGYEEIIKKYKAFKG
jgi:hypothetical protein